MRALKSTNDFNNAHWFMPSDKKKCYSYIRWSSDKQSGGSTLARQLKTAQEIAVEQDLELVEMIDSGISAFKGKNAKDGELGRFIDAVENKLIPKDSWLVVENLDRLSREAIINAQQLFLKLMELGITVVTGMDKKIYSRKSITENPMELMYSIMLFSRAHEESKTKSKRTHGNALNIIEKYNNSERSADGFAIAIKSVGTNMWWSDCSDGSVKPHPIYFPIAQEIINLAIDKGMGSHSITNYLNKHYANILPKTKSNKDGSWSLNRVSQFLQKRAMIGEKKLNIDGTEYVLADYYPALCNEETFYKMRSLRQGRTQKPEHTDKVYLFLGRDIIFCGHCGAKMTSHTTNENKEKGKYDKFRYKCASGQNATGKSQLAFQICINALKSGKEVLFEDTTGGFRPERLVEMIGLQNMDLKILDKIKIARITDSIQQIQYLSKIPIDNFSLIIIDNVSDLFSFEYSKKNNFLEKHLSFMRYMYDLSRISITTRIPIVVTNIVRNADDNEIENLEKSISMYSHVKIKLSKINHEYTCQIISPFNSQKISYVISTGGLTNPS